MGSSFTSGFQTDASTVWERIGHQGSGHFEFFKVRRFGALHFVKRPTDRYRHDLVTTEALKKEFHVGYNLSHQAVVKYLLMEDGAVYEEYIDGMSLREMIDRGDERLRRPAFVEAICRQLMDALSYIHSCGVIHNDIKPENVMVTRIGNQVKLVDFGCAYTDAWDATQGYTTGYKAPEQGEGETNVCTDIYLAGKLMAELAPRAGVNRRWSRFIRKATAENQSERFASDSEAIAAIPRGCRRGVTVTAAVAVLLLTGVIVFALARRSGAGDDDVPEVAAVEVDYGSLTENVIDTVAHSDAGGIPEVNHPSNVAAGENEERISYLYRVYNGESLTVSSSCKQLFASFGRCDSLKTLVLRDNLESMEGSLVFADRLSELTVPNSCRIVNGCFSSAENLKSLDLGSGVEEINNSFKSLRDLTRLEIPSCCKEIAGSFGRMENLEELVISDGVEKITDSFVYLPKLKRLTIPGSCKEVSGFTGLPALEELIIEEGVERVMAFGNNENLKKITLPSTLIECDRRLKSRHDELQDKE